MLRCPGAQNIVLCTVWS